MRANFFVNDFVSFRIQSRSLGSFGFLFFGCIEARLMGKWTFSCVLCASNSSIECQPKQTNGIEVQK